jgi:hypothetical protein
MKLLIMQLSPLITSPLFSLHSTLLSNAFSLHSSLNIIYTTSLNLKRLSNYHFG